MLIDGQDVPSAATRTVHDPATGEPIAEVADASAVDADRAVAAAKAAFRRGDWSRITPAERAGRSVIRDAADSLMRVHMEMGGKVPFVVFADADLEAAAEGAFANCGQDCTAATRIYVDDAVRADFLEFIGSTRKDSYDAVLSPESA